METFLATAPGQIAIVVTLLYFVIKILQTVGGILKQFKSKMEGVYQGPERRNCLDTVTQNHLQDTHSTNETVGRLEEGIKELVKESVQQTTYLATIAKNGKSKFGS